MNRTVALLLVCAINALIAVGDLSAKRATTPTGHGWQRVAALVLWFAACCIWLPLMRADGFTRLVAFADAVGLAMLAVLGYFFLGERMVTREWCGVGFALASIFLLGGK